MRVMRALLSKTENQTTYLRRKRIRILRRRKRRLKLKRKTIILRRERNGYLSLYLTLIQTKLTLILNTDHLLGTTIDKLRLRGIYRIKIKAVEEVERMDLLPEG